jgi:hypothetical protein
MSSNRIIAAFAVGALLAAAMDGSASAQTAGQIFAFHSQPVGDCPELDWYLVVRENGKLLGVVAWNDMNLFRDIFPAARCVLLICFLSTTNTPQLAAGIFYFRRAPVRDHRREKVLSHGCDSNRRTREDRCCRRSIWPRRMDHGQYQGAKCRLQKHPRAVV